jgi:predicted metal-dependent phosphoesterase TrpH
LVNHAAELGLKVMAVTDHDVTDAIAPATTSAAELGITVIPAIEVTVEFESYIQHLLLFNVDIEHPDIKAVLEDSLQRQHESACQGLSTLRQRGMTLAVAEQIAGDKRLLPIHVARALIHEHAAANIDEAIVIGESAGISFDIAANMTRTIEAGHNAGGVAILAHPGRAEYGQQPATAERLRAMLTIGLDGLEVYHGLHSAEDIDFYGQFAREYRLLVSCGSDSHGPDARTKPTPWPAKHCAALLERCGVKVIDN